ncbi:hypothetical protein VE02_07482 [Pseudogymnoascus sp. 03VT05]|nr:hypothetical protein VE02_07482 [Pseudogymnoascus sp. 03VT05]
MKNVFATGSAINVYIRNEGEDITYAFNTLMEAFQDETTLVRKFYPENFRREDSGTPVFHFSMASSMTLAQPASPPSLGPNLAPTPPLKSAPRMGLNAYFTYTVVGFHGPKPVSCNLGITAVFVEGLVFMGP